MTLQAPILQARASRLIPAAPDEVWETLTSKEGMKAYMLGADVEADWRVGGQIHMHGEYQGKAFDDHGEVRSFEPGRKLAYTHESSAMKGEVHLVTFELSARDGGTELTVRQEGDKPADDKTRAMYEETWGKMLEGVETATAN
jgi:uncharacterized protein YndB with AHSA1/START domain